MRKIKNTLLGLKVLSSGLVIMNGYASALEWTESSHALPAAPQWRMQSVEEALAHSLGSSLYKDLAPRAVVDPEPFHQEKEEGKIFLSFHKRELLGDRELDNEIVVEEYEELKRPALWQRDAEEKLSKLIVQSYFVKNSVEVPFGEETAQIFSWIKIEPTEEEKKQTRELDGVEYELHSTQEVWEAEPKVKISVDRPREEWKKVYVAPPLAPQPAPAAQHVFSDGEKKVSNELAKLGKNIEDKCVIS